MQAESKRGGFRIASKVTSPIELWRDMAEVCRWPGTETTRFRFNGEVEA
jgi:hypothetical protein